jgi:hypothetical protein
MSNNSSLNEASLASMESLLLARPAPEAMVRQTSIDDLFHDINSTISVLNTSPDSYSLVKADSFMVDDGFINNIATPVDDSRYEDSAVSKAAPWPTAPYSFAGQATSNQQPGFTIPWLSPSKVSEVDTTMAPPVAPATQTVAVVAGSLVGGYEIESVVKYVAIILHSVPLKELHITVLGTLFHRGSEKCVVDKAARKFLFQQTIEFGVNNGIFTRKGDSPVDFIVALNRKSSKDGAKYTHLERIVMWILKDEYQHIESIRSGHQPERRPSGHSIHAAHSSTNSSDSNNEFIQVKTLQYAAKSKSMRNGLFIFPLSLSNDTGKSNHQLPSGFLNEIPCENSCYAVLFQQSLQHFASLQIIEYSMNSTGVRLLEKARKAIQHPEATAEYSDHLPDNQKQASTVPHQSSPSLTAGGAAQTVVPLGPPLTATPVQSTVHSKANLSVANSKAPVAAAAATPGHTDSELTPNSTAGGTNPVVLSRSVSGTQSSLPWQQQGNFMVLEIPADDATVLLVPSLLKMAAVTDAMDVGTIQRVEWDTGCEVRDISVQLRGEDGKYYDEYRLLVKGSDPVNRQMCLEKLKRIMNGIRATPTLTSALECESEKCAAVAASEGAVIVRGTSDRFRANQFVEINAMYVIYLPLY